MFRKRAWVWLLPLLPLGVGVLMGVLQLFGILPNSLLRVSAELLLHRIVWGVGLILTLGWLGVWLIRYAIQCTKTNTERTTQQLADEDRRRFLRSLDHELKNPLTAIRAGIANLSGGADPSTTKTLHSLDTQAVRLSKLVADLRKLADLETQPLQMQPVNVAVLLNETVELAKDRPDARMRNIALALPQAPWPVPSVLGDYDLLTLAIFNLIENALKYSEAGDTVEVRASDSDGFVTIDVADTGRGIPDEEVAHIFEELFRAKNARELPGSGLGLALVRAVIHRHRGNVAVRSREGQGTVFTVRLPVTNS